MAKPKVLVSDPISQTGVDALAEGGQLDVTFSPGLPHEELLKIIPDYSALVVRSQTKVGADVIAVAKTSKPSVVPVSGWIMSMSMPPPSAASW
jgi:D-3-phosphoglycerate dehydrogenase